MKFNWKNKKDKIRKRFSILRKEDLDYSLGREKEMLRRLSEKLGKTEAEMLEIIISL